MLGTAPKRISSDVQPRWALPARGSLAGQPARPAPPRPPAQGPRSAPRRACRSSAPAASGGLRPGPRCTRARKSRLGRPFGRVVAPRSFAPGPALRIAERMVSSRVGPSNRSVAKVHDPPEVPEPGGTPSCLKEKSAVPAGQEVPAGLTGPFAPRSSQPFPVLFEVGVCRCGGPAPWAADAASVPRDYV